MKCYIFMEGNECVIYYWGLLIIIVVNGCISCEKLLFWVVYNYYKGMKIYESFIVR